MSETNNNNKRKSGIRRMLLILWPYIPAILIFLLVRLAVLNPLMVERYYSKGLYPFVAKLFSFFSSLVPFSLWDLFWIAFALALICGFILVTFKKIKFSWYILRLTQLLALLYSIFYLSWGFNYFRPGIGTRAGWESPKIDEQLFRSVIDTLIIHTNRSYTQYSVSEYPAIDKLVEESFRKNSRILGLNYPNGTRRPKNILLSSYFAKSGVSGYFGPFFNEIQLNSYVFPEDYAFLLAHEKAHQFGIASESEANLVAFIICTSSDDPRLEYSGYMYLLLYFLKDAEQMDDYHEFIMKIDTTVIENVRFREKYYDGLQNKTLENVQTAVNDAYLKSNHIKKGVKNYNQVVALVISWYYNSSLIKERQ
jgi:hypothetical protein